MITRARTPFRGMGQAYTGGSCQYQVPGITLIPGIPICGPSGYQMTAAQIAAVKLAQQQGGYSDTSEPGSFQGAFSSPGAAAMFGATYGGALPAYAALVQSKAPVQSNAPNPTPVVAPKAPSTPVQSNAPNQTPASTSSFLNMFAAPVGGSVPIASTPLGGCFSLFSGESCIGPIGSTTLLVGAAGIFGLFLLFGGHK